MLSERAKRLSKQIKILDDPSLTLTPSCMHYNRTYECVPTNPLKPQNRNKKTTRRVPLKSSTVIFFSATRQIYIIATTRSRIYYENKYAYNCIQQESIVFSSPQLLETFGRTHLRTRILGQNECPTSSCDAYVPDKLQTGVVVLVHGLVEQQSVIRRKKGRLNSCQN